MNELKKVSGGIWSPKPSPLKYGLEYLLRYVSAYSCDFIFRTEGKKLKKLNVNCKIIV